MEKDTNNKPDNKPYRVTASPSGIDKVWLNTRFIDSTEIHVPIIEVPEYTKKTPEK